MLLGGLRYLLPVIEEAHKLDAYVITVDYLPDNIAHKYSDEYHNISILDRDAVLELARKCEIDGIMSFAVDPGVVTAAYVAQELGLPFQGNLKTIEILQDKGRFRAFLAANGFNVPVAKSYASFQEAIEDKDLFHWPVIVKPVDSAGSKGVTKVTASEDLPAAVKYALEESHCQKFIIEDFLEMEGHSSDSEGFSVNGELVFNSFSDQYFDGDAANPYTPSAYVWPSSMPQGTQEELTAELQRMMRLLDLKTGIYNIETRLCRNGKAYIMECSPRGGGNRLAEMIDMHQSNHLIENAVRAALGMDPVPFSSTVPDDIVGEIILHSPASGVFSHIELADTVKPYIVQEELRVAPGDPVQEFTGANNAIGTIVLRTPDEAQMTHLINSVNEWCKVIVRE